MELDGGLVRRRFLLLRSHPCCHTGLCPSTPQHIPLQLCRHHCQLISRGCGAVLYNSVVGTIRKIVATSMGLPSWWSECGWDVLCQQPPSIYASTCRAGRPGLLRESLCHVLYFLWMDGHTRDSNNECTNDRSWVPQWNGTYWSSNITLCVASNDPVATSSNDREQCCSGGRSCCVATTRDERSGVGKGYQSSVVVRLGFYENGRVQRMQRRRSRARWPIDNLHIAPTDSVHLAFVVFAIHFWVDMLSQLEMLFGGPVSTHTHTRHQTHSLVDSSLPLWAFECESFSLLIAPAFSSILSRMTFATPN